MDKLNPTPLFFNRFWQLVLIAFVIIIAYALFPGEQLLPALTDDDDVSAVDFRYSVLLFPKYTGIPLSPSIIKKDPTSVIKQLGRYLEQIKSMNIDAQVNNAPNLWMAYLILRSITLNKETAPSVKKMGRSFMVAYFDYYQNRAGLTDGQLKIFARDSLAMESASWAIHFFERAMHESPEQTGSFYSEVVRAALWAQDCQRGANIALFAKRRAQTLNEKRFFFFWAIQSLFQCQQYQEAMQLAKHHRQGLAKDPLTYQLLADYALRAGNPKLAQEWIEILLHLKSD
jgi:hypothetical protein